MFLSPKLFLSKLNIFSSSKCFHHTCQRIPVTRESLGKAIPAIGKAVAAPAIHTPARQFCLSSIGRRQQTPSDRQRQFYRSCFYYISAGGVLVFGLTWAAVPLYRIFCQSFSYGGTVKHDQDGEKVEAMATLKERRILISFQADTAAAMQWNFRPQQSKIELSPGETALAFYTAKNPTDRVVVGVSTYNVVPYMAGQYFNKIQCFCFEEQMLNPGEEVHMPVFFYIDPEFADDPAMDGVKTITLSYTFFEADPDMEIPLPGFMTMDRNK